MDGSAPLDILIAQYAEAHGMYPEDVIDREGSLYWITLWRELRNAQTAKRKRELEAINGG